MSAWRLLPNEAEQRCQRLEWHIACSSYPPSNAKPFFLFGQKPDNEEGLQLQLIPILVCNARKQGQLLIVLFNFILNSLHWIHLGFFVHLLICICILPTFLSQNVVYFCLLNNQNQAKQNRFLSSSQIFVGNLETDSGVRLIEVPVRDLWCISCVVLSCVISLCLSCLFRKMVRFMRPSKSFYVVSERVAY